MLKMRINVEYGSRYVQLDSRFRDFLSLKKYTNEIMTAVNSTESIKHL